MLALILGYFAVNLLLTAIFFAIALLIRWRSLGSNGVSFEALRHDADWFALFGGIGLCVAIPLTIVFCVVMVWVACMRVKETAEAFAKCECSV